MAEETKSGPYTLATLKPNPHSRPKRTRVGRGHGSGMVKTAGEGGKGQTVRSGGGKGPAFGQSRSHSMVATKRRFDPNLQKVRILVGKAPKRVYVCTRCLKAGKVTKAL